MSAVELWERGIRGIAKDVIEIEAAYADFNDFWSPTASRLARRCAE